MIDSLFDETRSVYDDAFLVVVVKVDATMDDDGR